MKTVNLTLRRLTMLLIALLASTTMGWAGNFDSPQEFVETDADLPVPMMKAPSRGGTFGLSPVIVGDVDRDGRMNIADVTTLINALLQHNVAYINGDVDGDGRVNISDVTALINRLLSNTVETRLSVTELAAAINNVYYLMSRAAWTTTGNTHQCFGISAYTLTGEVMGDDMIMGGQGSGWFWFDATYNVKTSYTSDSWRSHDLWTAYYTWIAEANSIISQKDEITGDANLVNYYVGQAFALRAYSYFMLAQWFSRTYKGHESDPCVPLFYGSTFNRSTGALRSTVAEIYAQIESDINQATSLLNGSTQLSPEHISYAVALGLKSRILLVEEKWSSAYIAARGAITAFENGDAGIQEVSAFNGMNDVTAGNVMWGIDIPASESQMYASLFAHMSTTIAYGQRAPKLISKWLYNKMSATDARRAWWVENTTGTGSDALVQNKFNVVEGTEWEGDYIWMRVEEMYLNAAEALAHRGGMDATARNYLNQLMAKRDPNYSCNKTGNGLGDLTTDETGSLLEEILIQRRLELWGEDCRIHTIRRLHQGFERTVENGWPNALLLPTHTDAVKDSESYPWVMTIPLSEYYNYYARMILAADQNPIGDYPEGDAVEIERTPQHLSFGSPTISLEISAATTTDLSIGVFRTGTSSKPYYALLRLTDNETGVESWYYVSYAPGESVSDVKISFIGENMAIGRHTYTLSLTDLEMSVANSSQLTSTQIVVDVMNFGAEGQHISFATANQNKITYSNVAVNFQEVPVTLTRAITTEGYKAHVTISNQTNPDDIRLVSEDVIFAPGESTATAMLYFYNMECGDTYSCVLTLSDNDIATADPTLGAQITSTTVTVEVKSEDENWEPAGTCTFTDFWEDGGYTAQNVPIQKSIINDNEYRIVSPLAYVYDANYSFGPGDASNWIFTLNPDGSIAPVEGMWEMNYWGYYGYYDSSRFPDYCYVEKNGNTYDVNFVFKRDDSLFGGGHFAFTWNR